MDLIGIATHDYSFTWLPMQWHGTGEGHTARTDRNWSPLMHISSISNAFIFIISIFIVAGMIGEDGWCEHLRVLYLLLDVRSFSDFLSLTSTRRRANPDILNDPDHHGLTVTVYFPNNQNVSTLVVRYSAQPTAKNTLIRWVKNVQPWRQCQGRTGNRSSTA